MTQRIKILPKHIAFIMDGNGRWATKRGLARYYGHKEGIKAVERTMLGCKNFGIEYCTFFAFSTENWRRGEDEINGIFGLLRDYLNQNKDFFIKNQIKVNYIGVLDPFPEDLKSALLSIVDETKNIEGLTVTFALNYGGRDDIIRAVNKLLQNNTKQTSEKDFLAILDTKEMPEPDFVVRTSGEQRISNFLLFQMAYCELYFPKIYWPSFNERQLEKCLLEYQKRNRRFGGVNK